MGGGLTRNSIIGKANRMKLPKRRTAAPRSNIARIRRTRAARTNSEHRISIKLGNARKSGAASLEEALARVKPKPIIGSVWEALPDTTPISLLLATDETCRWPIGDPLLPGFGYCGCPVDGGSVYCLEHRARATTNFKATAEDKRKLERSDRSRRVFA
jgi:GcrA cell cycle regulator